MPGQAFSCPAHTSLSGERDSHGCPGPDRHDSGQYRLNESKSSSEGSMKFSVITPFAIDPSLKGGQRACGAPGAL